MVLRDAGMATIDHTPYGRGYSTGMHYFHHENGPHVLSFHTS